MDAYRLREATLGDLDASGHHRIAMFTDMRVALDRAALEPAFRAWLRAQMPAGTYRAWVAEDATSAVVAGGRMTIVPWPPGPSYPGVPLAFVYNIYTESAHRRRGLAGHILDAMHAWGRANGIGSLALNTSADGRRSYEAKGDTVTPNPMMFRRL